MERPIRTKFDILACILTLTLPKIIVIGPQGRVPPIKVKSVNWGLEHSERPIHTKFDISACILTLTLPKIIVIGPQGRVPPV